MLAGALVIPLLALSALAWLGWRETWAGAERELSRSAEAGAEYSLRLVEGQRLAADTANDILAGLRDEEIRSREAELHARLRERVPRLPLVQTVVVLDREARPLVSADTFPVPRDLRFDDREWVQALRAPAPPPLHVSSVQVGRLNGFLFYGVSRRRENTGNAMPPGAYDGLVNISVNPNAVARGFGTIGGEPGDVASLVRADGEVLVRTPGFPERLPQIPRGSSLRDAAARGDRAGVYLGQTLGLAGDRAGDARLIAFRRVGDLPLYVTLARPTPLIVARWRETLRRQLAIGIPTIMALVGLAWLALRRSRAAETAEAALRREVAERATAEARRAAEARFRGVFESRVVGMAVHDLPSGDTLLANDRLLEMTGQTRADLDAGRFDLSRATPEEARALDEAALEEARRRGWWDPYETEFVQHDGSRLAVRVSSAPLPGEPGRLVVMVQDISEQREAETRRDLLRREVDHRAKNALATAQAAVRLTDAPDLESFRREVDGRIGALARAIEMLAATGWQGVGLRDLIEAELAPFVAGTGRARPRTVLRGAAVMLRAWAVQPLAMALHELATNATKYGALSRADGVVTIDWDVRGGDLRLTWHERGGPALAGAPSGRGFGTRVIEGTVQRQLGGVMERAWDPEGLACAISLPAARILEAEPAVVA
ncbi:HWE histidine kinase domain-containing protein [Roseomonas sp. CCTCC AB2023176]|uniref:HWE histidine kinase domain-containing protein n=1 Tax=Roseomonas sp. CCTCC AB2023176 TaxID=3342640 RepID=UPI0035D63686